MAQRMVRDVSGVRSRGAVVSVALARLAIRSSFREAGVNNDHVRRLVGLGGRWPPILVHQDNGLVVDGVHRVVAARVLGLDHIDATLFRGGPDEALIEFVRRNVHHGLPLTLRERKRAAGQVLVVHPEWSDRRIAETCALSPKTVGRLRVSPSEDGGQLDTEIRVGRDDRSRPVNSASVRVRVIEAIRERPGASLRSVAAEVGVSPETVRLVRMNMGRPAGSDVTETSAVSEAFAGSEVAAGSEASAASGVSGGRGGGAEVRELGRSAADVAPASEVAEEFLVWFGRTAVCADDCAYWVDLVGLDCVPEIAEEARRRSVVWRVFAESLETRFSQP